MEKIKTYKSPSNIEMILVESSNIHSVGHLFSTKLLEVHFKNGTSYTFHPITEEGFKKFMESESKGKFFNEFIKNNPTVTSNKENFTIDIIKTQKMATSKSKEKPVTSQTHFDALREGLNLLEKEFTSYSTKGNKAAARRSRAIAMDLVKAAKAIRLAISVEVKAAKE